MTTTDPTWWAFRLTARLAQAKEDHLEAQREVRKAKRSWNQAREDLARSEAAFEKVQSSLERVRGDR